MAESYLLCAHWWMKLAFQHSLLQWPALPALGALDRVCFPWYEETHLHLLGSLLSRSRTQSACLQLACAIDAGALMGRACSLHSQIRGLAAGHVGISILWSYLLHSARQESLWSGTSPVCTTWLLWWGRNCLEVMPVKVGRLGGVVLQGYASVEHTVVVK